jgi:hypothetical protein
MRSQLERDLTLNASHRLKRWVGDTLMRCDVVGLSPAQEAAILSSVLLEELLHVFDAIGMPPIDAAKLVHDGLRLLRENSGKKDTTSQAKH